MRFGVLYFMFLIGNLSLKKKHCNNKKNSALFFASAYVLLFISHASYYLDLKN